MPDYREQPIQSIGRSYILLRRIQTSVLTAESPQVADAELGRIDALAQAAGHVAVAASLRQGLQEGIMQLDQLLDEYSPDYQAVPGTSRYFRNPFVKAQELLLNVLLFRSFVRDGQSIPLSPRLDGQMIPLAAMRQYLSRHRRLYTPITDNVDAYARNELVAAGIGQRFGGEFEVVSMAVDPASQRTVMRSDIQVTERNPMIFLDQSTSGDTLAAVRAGLEARADHAIDPIIL